MSRMRILATNAERERLNVLAERCRALPDAPGVYLMRSSSGRVLYVGKAVSLRKRLASYFSARVSAKTRRLLRQTESIEHVQLGSELEALLEESRLIKLHQSPFNVLLRSYHNYPFIKLDEQGMYPRLVVTREVQDDEAIYFGPFKSVRATEQTVEILSRCFRLYDGRCPERASGSSCLYQQMRRCLAPCLGPEYLVKHRKAVEDVCRLLETDPEGLVEELTRRMDDAAGRLDFEAAALYRDGIDALKVAVARKRLLAPAIEGLNVLAICPSVYPDWVEAFVFGRGRLLDRGRLFVGDGGPDRSAVADFLNEVVIGRAKQGGPITNRIDAQGLDQVNIISKWLDHHGSAATSITLEPLWVEDRFSDVMERVAQAARVAARTRVL